MPNSNNTSRTLNTIINLVERTATLEHRLRIAENSLKAKQELIDDQHAELKQLRGWSDTRTALSPTDNLGHLHIPAFHANRKNRAK